MEKNNRANRCPHPTTALHSLPCSSSSSPYLISGSAEVSLSSSSSSSEGRMSGVGGSALEVDHSSVKIEEMEAAEALAGLAHWGVCESKTRTFQFGGKWGSKGKRASQRVKNQSPSPPDSGLRAPNCSTPMSSDHAEGLRNSEQTHKTIIVKRIKAGKDIESPKPLSTFTLNYASCGGSKLRQNMTEAEKETRRLRRVLANRESARQTIRRRQALCEALSRKATDLEWENINLKTEKELAMKEYQSLKNTNECLKAQVANAVKPEVDEASVDFKLPFNHHVAKTVKARVEEAPKSSNNVPSTSQRGSPNGTISFEVPFPLPASGSWPQPSQKESSLTNRNGSAIPFYVLPSPWFFRLPEIKHEHTQQTFNPNDRLDETFTSNNPTVSSSKTIPRIDDPLQSLPVKFKAEALTESASKLQDAQCGFPRGGDGLDTELLPGGMVLLPFPYNSLSPPVSAICKNGIQADHDQAISSKEGHSAPTFIENTRELSTGPSKMQVGLITAAEARKRRKELTKLKNLHSHQCRIPS